MILGDFFSSLTTNSTTSLKNQVVLKDNEMKNTTKVVMLDTTWKKLLILGNILKQDSGCVIWIFNNSSKQ